MSQSRFQPRRFQNAASHYVPGRVPYASRLIARVAELTGLGPTHQVLDLGCGRGPLARAFAPRAAQVLGVDPEPEMLRIARQDAPRNIAWRQASSYDIAPDWGQFRLVTMGRSFHWMDRADTLSRLEALVPEGAVALFQDTHPELPENAWWDEYRSLVRRHEPERATAHRQPGWMRHEAVLLDSAFSRLERHAVIERRQASISSLVSRGMSRSSIAMARAAGVELRLGEEIEALLAPYAQNSEVTEIVATEALIGFRTA